MKYADLRAERARLVQALCDERAEVERLKAYEAMWHEQYASDLVQARAEIERLESELADFRSDAR
jgi:hypothetical protein